MGFKLHNTLGEKKKAKKRDLMEAQHPKIDQKCKNLKAVIALNHY
jgi:hypothetical protein